MSTLEPLIRRFRFEEWANRNVLGSLRSLDAAPSKAVRWFAHIVGTEYLWLARIESAPSPYAVWPDWDLATSAIKLDELGTRRDEFLAKQTPETLDQPVKYINSKGEAWMNSVSDILEHILLHSSYHRGQIAADLAGAGHTPAYTDFIEAVRRGIIDERR